MAARNEPGNQWTNKEWRDAIRISARRPHGEGTKLQAIADNLVESALGGDLLAIKEVGDRLDGKPNQSHDVQLGANEQLLALIEGRLGKARGAA